MRPGFLLRPAGAAPSPILWAADFTGLAPGSASLAGFGLALTRASGASVQTSASAVLTGLGNDTARAGYNGTQRGLVLEEARTNLIANPRDMLAADWQPGSLTSATSNVENGPDGAALADQMVGNGSTVSNYYQLISVPAVTTASWWRKRRSGQGTGSSTGTLYAAAPTSSANLSFNTTLSDSVWQRARVTGIANGAVFVPDDARNWGSLGGPAPASYNDVLDLSQLEAGAFDTEWTPGARAGERLYYPGGAALVDSGRLSLELVLQPKGGQSDYGANMRLWTDHANPTQTFVEVDKTARQLVVSVGGVAYTTPGVMPWVAGETLSVFVGVGGGLPTKVCSMSPSSGTHPLSTGSPPTQASVSLSGDLDLLCNDASGQFTAWVRSLAAYRNGQAPGWVI